MFIKNKIRQKVGAEGFEGHFLFFISISCLVDVTEPDEDLLEVAGRSTVVEPLRVKALSALPESSKRT